MGQTPVPRVRPKPLAPPPDHSGGIPAGPGPVPTWLVHHPAQVVALIVAVAGVFVGTYDLVLGRYYNGAMGLAMAIGLLLSLGIYNVQVSRRRAQAATEPEPLAVLRELYATDAITLAELEQCTAEVLAGQPLRCPAANRYSRCDMPPGHPGQQHEADVGRGQTHYFLLPDPGNKSTR